MRTLGDRRLRKRVLGGLPSYPFVVLADNPAHYWRFEETSGSTAADLVGAADLTLVSDPSLNIEGAVGSAIGFNSFNRAEIPAGIPEQPFPLTIEWWMRTVTSDRGFMWGVLGGGIMLAARLNSNESDGASLGSTHFMWRNANTGSAFTRWAISESSLYDGGWHHVALSVTDVRDDEQIATYVDGELVTQTFQQTNFSGTVWSPTSPVWLGGINGSTPNAVVDIDEFAVYLSALSGDRIAAHYAAAT